MDHLQIKLNTSILVLNSDYNPLNICNARRAIVLLLKKKAQLISEKIIRLVEYIRIPYQKLIDDKPTRNLIYKRDQFSCGYCGSKQSLTIDHIIPRSRGGEDTWENLVTSCSRCNTKKGNKTPKEANMKLLFQPKVPVNKLHLTISVSNINEWKDYIFS
jgi:5-methylcytosine-specific restriction endonuclease McrA